jgi:hypothetical protein
MVLVFHVGYVELGCCILCKNKNDCYRREILNLFLSFLLLLGLAMPLESRLAFHSIRIIIKFTVHKRFNHSVKIYFLIRKKNERNMKLGHFYGVVSDQRFKLFLNMRQAVALKFCVSICADWVRDCQYY